MIARNPIDAIPGLEHPAVQFMLSVFCDAIGMFTYIVPVIGEYGDVVWVFIQTPFIYAMVGGEGNMGYVLTAVGFIEEALPMTDFVPSCTIAWIYKYVRK